jgi:hypothetical protein
MILGKIKAIFRQRGYVLHERPFELNIVGIRSKNVLPQRFDDEIHVFYRASQRKWNYHIFKATTDPGTFWLRNPIQEQGTAILAQGQYRNAYSIGLHQGKYNALVQAKPVRIIRDYDRNAKLDFLNGIKEKGFFGINIHRAFSEGRTKFIDKFSAGCQVFQNANDFEKFMEMCRQHSILYGNQFTYTLIDFRALRREALRRMTIGALTLGIGLIGYHYYDHE